MQSKEPTVTSNSETATPTTTTTEDVTTSNTDPAFQPFQQLHEAVLAAVNSHSASLPNSIFSAAVAAAAAGNVAIHPQPFEQAPAAPLTDAEKAKKENIRASNRERKKKWRLHNEERNKDNDLRCRVNKRANKLYGPNDSVAKQQWIQEEFEKRRQKRLDKDRKKHIMNDALTGTTSASTGNMDATVQLPDMANQISYYTPLPQIDTATAAKLLDFPTDLHRQLLEQLNNSMLALSNGLQQPTQTQEDQNTVSTENHSVDTTSFTETEVVKDEETKPNTDNDTVMNEASTEDVVATNEALQQAITQGLSSSASTADNSNHNSPSLQYPTMEVDESEEPSDEAKSEAKEEEEEEADVKEEKKGEKKPEYPMDAVLTLMQLNAGWRQ